MARIAVVTDSTSDVPQAQAERLGLRVVPLSVSFGDETLISGVTIEPEAFYARLAASDRAPTTSQPAPAWFEEAYADAADDGCEAVLSVHCSGALSGTVALARARAAEASLPVEVLDSRLVGGSLGLATLAGHRVASGGGELEEVIAAVRAVTERVTSLLVVDSLTHLKRGGRLTGAQALMGSVLRVKPLLHVTEGRLEVRERTRTWSRALARLVAAVEQVADDGEVDVVVAHAIAPERAAQVWAALDERVAIRERSETLIGPIVGAHVGPGAVGVAAVPSDRP